MHLHFSLPLSLRLVACQLFCDYFTTHGFYDCIHSIILCFWRLLYFINVSCVEFNLIPSAREKFYYFSIIPPRKFKPHMKGKNNFKRGKDEPGFRQFIQKILKNRRTKIYIWRWIGIIEKLNSNQYELTLLSCFS